MYRRRDRAGPEDLIERAVIPTIEPDADCTAGVVETFGDELFFDRQDVDVVAWGWVTEHALD
jgi:hypothetical protein